MFCKDSNSLRFDRAVIVWIWLNSSRDWLEMVVTNDTLTKMTYNEGG